MKKYDEVHQQGYISVENKDIILDRECDFTQTIEGDIGIQIANDGRIWVCIDGIAFIRFHPYRKGEGK